MKKGLPGSRNTKHRHRIVPVRTWGCLTLQLPATLHSDLTAAWRITDSSFPPSLCSEDLILSAFPWTMSLGVHSAFCSSLASENSSDACCLLTHCPQLCNHHDFLSGGGNCQLVGALRAETLHTPSVTRHRLQTGGQSAGARPRSDQEQEEICCHDTWTSL